MRLSNFKYQATKAISDFRYANVWLMLMYALGFGILLMGMPKYGDDYWYLSGLSRWLEAHDVSNIDDGVSLHAILTDFPSLEIVDTFSYHFYVDNSRLSNMAGFAALFLPKWGASGIVWVAWLATMWGSFKLAGTDWRRTPLTPIAMAFWLYALAWHDQMGSVIFQFNYVVPAALGVLFVCWLIKIKKGSQTILLALLLGIIVGAWHEAFSFPILCASIYMACRYKRYRTHKIASGCIGLCIGLCWLLTCEKYQGFLHGTVESTATHSVLSFVKLIAVHPAVIGALITWGICMMRRKSWKTFTGHAGEFMLVSGLVALPIAWFTSMEQRVGWWSDIAAVVLILLMLRQNFAIFRRGWKPLSAVVFMPLAAACIVTLGYADAEALRIRNDFRQIVADMDNDSTRNVYVRFESIDQSPFMRGPLPDLQIYRGPICLWLNIYFKEQRSNPDFYKPVLPLQFRHLTRGMGESKPSNRDLRIINGAMYIPLDTTLLTDEGSYDSMVMHVRYRHRGGYEYTGRMLGYRFRSDGDGKEYLWLTVPMKFWLPWRLFPIEEVTFIPAKPEKKRT